MPKKGNSPLSERKKEETHSKSPSPASSPSLKAKKSKKKHASSPSPSPSMTSPPQPIQKTIVPNHSIKIDRRRNVVLIRVDLPRIPPQYIKYEPTSTHLVVDTTEYSKKFFLSVEYPENVRVFANEESAADYEYGSLKAELPIISDQEESMKQTLLTKRKRETEAPSKVKKTEEDEAINEAEAEVMKKKKKKKGKRFISNEEALALVDQINDRVEENQQKKMMSVKKRIEAINQFEGVKEKRAEEKGKKKEKLRAEAIASLEEEKKQKKQEIQEKKKKKKNVAKENRETPEDTEMEESASLPKPILKPLESPKSSKKKRVSFSPKVRVVRIPKAEPDDDPIVPELGIRRSVLLSRLQEQEAARKGKRGNNNNNNNNKKKKKKKRKNKHKFSK